MQLQGIRIEYLIIGGLSIVWICPLTNLLVWSNSQQNTELSLNEAIVLIPIVYTIGMIVDAIAALALRKIKVKSFENSELTKNDDKKNFINQLVLKNIEFYKLIDVKQTRYRIMRGAWLNFMLCTVMLVVNFLMYKTPFGLAMSFWQKTILIAILSSLTYFCYYLWRVYMKRYYRDLVKMIEA